MKMLVYDTLSERHIRTKIRLGWGLGRIFRFFRTRHPLIGESLVLARILFVVRFTNRRFPRNTVTRVMREFDEALDGSVRVWLLLVSEGMA